MITCHLKVKAVLFDLDGTLVDTLEFVYQAYEFTLKTHKLKSVSRKVLGTLIGKEITAIYNMIAPGFDASTLIKTHNDFQNKKMDLIESYPEVEQVVKKIKKMGIKMGVVTSRLRNSKETLEVAGLGGLFEVIISAEDVTHHKPHPECVLLALKKLKVKATDAILVGDSSFDIQTGKNAKVKIVGVTYGFFGESIKESNPDFIIDKLEEILKIIQ